jgi:hypothetical protein
MNRTADRGIVMDAPGFAGTFFAPDDNAMRTLFDKLGEWVDFFEVEDPSVPLV